MVLLATLLGALLTAAAPGPSEPVFTRAYLTYHPEKPSNLCFDSPVELDWEAMARRELKSFDLDNPPREELLKHSREVGGSTLTFPAALPEDLKRRHFYLLTEKGAQPIVPKQLLGSVRYGRYSKDEYGPPRFFGEICLPVPNGLDDAGLVATSKVPLSWREDPATLVREGSTTRVRLPSGALASIPPPGLNEHVTGVKSAYILSSTELATKYVLVRRVVNPPECEFIYDLYRWEPKLPVIASSAWRCDI